MIIIEGSDQTGKTTLARKLSERIALQLHGDDKSWERIYRHMGRPPDDFDHVSGYVDQVGPVVWDRFHLGALVYGKILRNGGCPSSKEMLWVQRYLRWQGAIVVVLHADRWWMKEHVNTTRKEMYTRDIILDANDLFRLVSKSANHGEPYCDFEHNVTDGNWCVDTDIDMIIEAWRDRWLS